GNPFSELQVRQIPLQTRNVVELLSVQPGVTSNGEVLGARRDQNNVTLDGADVNNNQNSGLIAQNTTTGLGGYQGSNANGANINSGFNAVLPIPLDSVEEFRVPVAGQGANMGRSSGGQVARVTKSGTNNLHGSVNDYNRNSATVANGWLYFSRFRFNAPSHRSDHAIVGKIDLHLDRAGKHTVSFRGTLADNTDDQILAQFPGQAPASTLRDNSKGFAAQYTAILRPNLVSVLNLSYTRFGQALSGVAGPVLFQTSLDPLQNPYARPLSQRLPTLNPNEDIAWTKGAHTITAGFSARFIHNNTRSFANSFARYGYGATELIGLGADIDSALTNFMSTNPMRFGPNVG